MPKQEIDGEELFNLALSIVGLILRDGPHTVAELVEHFGFSEKTIKKAVKTIGNTENLSSCQTYFYLDDELLEDGEVDFSQGFANLSEPPVLSKRQVSALATGLDYLAALPQFEDSEDLAKLREALGTGTPSVRVNKTGLDSVVQDIQKAMLEGVSISCSYRNQLGERSERRIDPLRLDFIADKHYLRGYCFIHQSVRSFRLDRIQSLNLLPEPISDAARAAEIPDEVFGDGHKEQHVRVAAKPEAAEIFWNFPSYSEISRSGDEFVGDILVGSLKALGRHVAKYGGLVRVLEPKEAIDAVRNFAQVALLEAAKDED